MYQRTKEMIHPQVAGHTATPARDVSVTQNPSPLTGQDSSDASIQTPPVQQEDATPAPKPVHKLHPKTHAPSAKPASQQEIAQNTPPTPPASDQPQQATP